MDKYTFQIWFGGQKRRDVYPIVSNGKITHKREGVQIIREYEANLTFVKSDFAFLYGLISDNTIDPCTTIFLYIYKYCSTDPYWVGTISLYEGKWDLDRCTWEIKPKEFTGYTCFFDNKGEDRNIIGTTEKKLVTYTHGVDYDIQFETVTFSKTYVPYSYSVPPGSPPNTHIYNGTCDAPLYIVPDWFAGWSVNSIVLADSFQNELLGFDPVSFENWFPNQFTVTNNKWTNVNLTAGYKGDVTCEFIRGYVITVDNVDGTANNPDPTVFTEHSATTMAGLPAHKFTSKFLVLDAGYMPEYEFTFVSGATCLDDVLTWKLNLLESQTDIFTAKSAQLLKDVITGFAEACNLTYESIFFDGSENPLETRDVPNPLNNLLIIPLFDLVNGPTSNSVLSKSMVSWDALFNELYAMFNVAYYIDVTNGKLIVEHISYFENGFSYTANTVGLDLTTDFPDSLQLTNSYEWDSLDRPKVENFRWYGASGFNFIGFPIVYNCTGTKEVLYENRIFTPDVFWAQNAQTQDSLFDKFVIIAVDQTIPYHPTYGYQIAVEQGYLSGNLIRNGHLSRANLHNKYWRHNRYNWYANMNDEAVTFISIKKQKKQTEIVIPSCCVEFDEYKLIRTNLGDGELDEMTEDMGAQTLTLKLRYE